MSASHEENWPAATNPRYLLKLSRVRPSGRQYALLACATVRHLWTEKLNDPDARGLDALERFAFAQPRKGVQTHVWRDVVAPAVAGAPEPAFRRAMPAWLRVLEQRFGALSQVSAADVNVLFGTLLPLADARAREAAWEEATRRCARRPAEEVRAEIVSRVGLKSFTARRALWPGISDANVPRFFLFNEVLEQRTEEVRARACDLIREIFGNPFRPAVIEPHWLTWNYGAVRHVAERIARSGDFHDLPVLGDALEDAGCCDAELLRHCREENGHAPGCWALDAVLGR